MIEKEHCAFLEGLDYILNKLIPKKYTVVIMMCIVTYLLKATTPPGFYIAIGIYFGGNAVVNSVKKKGDKGGPG